MSVALGTLLYWYGWHAGRRTLFAARLTGWSAAGLPLVEGRRKPLRRWRQRP